MAALQRWPPAAMSDRPEGLLLGDVIHVEQFGTQETLSIKVVSGVVASGGQAQILKGQIQFPGQLAEPPLLVAIKVISVKNVDVDQVRIERELTAVKLARHRHILPFIATLRAEKHTILVSKFMENGSMLEYLKANPAVKKEPLVMLIKAIRTILTHCEILEISDAVNHLHTSLGLVHGDLKCQNVLISDDGHALLADFGLSTTAGESVDPTATAIRACKTLRFAAPEILLETAKSPLGKLRSKTPQSDVYAFGMLIIQAFTGTHPWPNLGDMGIYMNVYHKSPYPRPEQSLEIGLTDPWWQLCKTCLEYEPEERPSIVDICSGIRMILDVREAASNVDQVHGGASWHRDNSLDFDQVISDEASAMIRLALAVGGTDAPAALVHTDDAPESFKDTRYATVISLAKPFPAVSRATGEVSTADEPTEVPNPSFEQPPLPSTSSCGGTSMDESSSTSPSVENKVAMKKSLSMPTNSHAPAGIEAYTGTVPDAGGYAPSTDSLRLMGIDTTSLPTTRPMKPATTGRSATADNPTVVTTYKPPSSLPSGVGTSNVLIPRVSVKTDEASFLRFDQNTHTHIGQNGPGYREANSWLLDAMRGPQKALEQLPPAKRDWPTVINAFQMCPLLIQSPERPIDRTDEYTIERRNWFKRDAVYKSVGDELVRWFSRFWSDSDVEEGPGATDMKAVHDIVAHAGSILDGDIIYKKERQTKTVLDIGVLRYPDISCPYIKVYRIELVAWYESTTVGGYTRDRNGLMAKFNLRQFEPDLNAIEEMRGKWRRDALNEFMRQHAEAATQAAQMRMSDY